MKCDNCGKVFLWGDTNGLPNGVMMGNITVCQECIIEFGKMPDSKAAAMIEQLKAKVADRAN